MADSKKLTRDDLKKMNPDQIETARRNGELEHMGIGSGAHRHPRPKDGEKA